MVNMLVAIGGLTLEVRDWGFLGRSREDLCQEVCLQKETKGSNG
jgi:hypothetical protein